MVSYRASKNSRVEDEVTREITSFEDARLVKMGECAYVELGKVPSSSKLRCAFCSKNSRHEHVFPGRVRFDPKEGKYYISFVQVKEEMEKCKDGKSSSSLQIIPVIPKPQITEERKLQSSVKKQIFPLVAYNENEATRTMLSSVSQWTDEGCVRSKVVAIKVVCSGELILARFEVARGGSGLTSLGSCELCTTSSEDSPESLASHLSAHGLSVRVRRVPEVDSVLDKEDGTLEDPGEYLSMEHDERQDAGDKIVCK